MKYLKTTFLIISTVVSISSMAAQYLSYDSLPPKAKQRAVKWSEKSRIFDGLTPEEIAIQLGWIVGASIPATPSEAREKIKRASANKKEISKSSSAREGFDPEMAAYMSSMHADPSVMWPVIQAHFKSEFDVADAEEKKGVIWVACARYKPGSDVLRPFSELGKPEDELIQHAQEKGILPHQFGEWFDGLPAEDANVKAIHLLTKVMGLPEDLAAEVMAARLSYDDYELIVDSKKTVDAIRAEIARRSSGIARAAASGAAGAAAAAAVTEPETEPDVGGSDVAARLEGFRSRGIRIARGSKVRGRGRGQGAVRGATTGHSAFAGRHSKTKKKPNVAAKSSETISEQREQSDFLKGNPPRAGKGTE